MCVGKKLLINASNLHVGGGVQVAASFLYEISRFESLPSNLVVWASTEVDKNLKQVDCDFAAFPCYEVVDSFGFRLIFSPLARRLRDFGVVFTIFGPLYAFPKPAVSIVGFAQAWIVYPRSEVYALLPPRERLFTRLKFFAQSIFFRLADLLIVELEHVQKALCLNKIGEQVKVEVVHNCLSSLYTEPGRWRDLSFPQKESSFKIGFVGRNYLHKNTQIFPAIRNFLIAKYGIHVLFYVTFTEEEWLQCDSAFKQAVINVGSLSVAQCPNFYKEMNAVIFPSLLECFSATPLEAMAMERPLFASDREFNRDVCEGFAYYFDPLNPENAADVIAEYIKSEEDMASSLAAARQHAVNFSQPTERAEKYLGYLVKAGTSTGIGH